MIYEKVEEERSFMIKVLNEFAPKFIEALSSAIINKFAIAMSGGDPNATMGEGGIVEDNPYFSESLSKNLSKHDLDELKKAGIDVSQLTSTNIEVI